MEPIGIFVCTNNSCSYVGVENAIPYDPISSQNQEIFRAPRPICGACFDPAVPAAEMQLVRMEAQ